jgi:hypothetical protein
MSNVINFEQAKPKQATEAAITSSPYYLCRNDEMGREIFREPFDGAEHVKTVCPKCHKEFWIDFYEFCAIVTQGFDFYGTSVYCDTCSQKHVRGRE